MGAIYTAGPNKTVIVSGGCCVPRNRVRIRGQTWAWACFGCTTVQELDMGVMTVRPNCSSVLTGKGVPLTVTAVAQVSFMRHPQLLREACECFLDLSPDEILYRICLTLNGHLRSTLSTMSVEDIVCKMVDIGKLVKEVASTDLGRMGIDVMSFTIQNISDQLDYLDSIGRVQLAIVQKNAKIGVAIAEAEASVREAECNRQAEEAVYCCKCRIALAARDLQLALAQNELVVKSAQAKADGARDHQLALINQQLAKDIGIGKVIERMKQAQIEECEVKRKQHELVSDVLRKADADYYSMITVAQGNKQRTVKEAHAQAESIRLIAEAEANVLSLIGAAEARGMKYKAHVYNNIGAEGVLQMHMETLPLLTKQVCRPLANVKSVVHSCSPQVVPGVKPSDPHHNFILPML